VEGAVDSYGHRWRFVIPADLVDRFMSVRLIINIGPPAFFQNVIADFMNEEHFARHLRRMRYLYREQRSALVNRIAEDLGSMVEVLGSESGMHLPVVFTHGISDLEIAERAARQNLWLWPLSRYYADKASRSGLVLGFGSTRVDEIPPAIHKLRKLLTSM
jgi:GntR family transcriptional regulator / MocR family aminotransferase